MINHNKYNFRLGVTHAGRFHADDVLSTVLLKSLFPKIKIERKATFNEKNVAGDIIVYDIGGGKFDHHKQDKEINEIGRPFSALGLLWREFGRQYLKKKHFTNIELAYRLFIEKYISKVDYGDNFGYKDVKNFAENDLIKSFNPLWYENVDTDKCFNKAVVFAKGIWENWTREIYQIIEMQKFEDDIWEKTKAKSENGIFVFEDGIPWKSVAQRHPDDNVFVFIGKSNREGYYIMPVDSTKMVIPFDDRLSFRHTNGHIGFVKDKDSALSIAKSMVLDYMSKKILAKNVKSCLL